jgi:hypothetical protein
VASRRRRLGAIAQGASALYVETMIDVGQGSGPARGARVPSKVAGRAVLTAVLWWMALAVGYLAFALSRPGARPGCDGWECLGDQGGYLVYGAAVGTPATMIGLPVDCIAISAVLLAARDRIRSGVLLGTAVTWVTFAVVGAALALWTHGGPH